MRLHRFNNKAKSNTSDIQEAINLASYSNFRTIEIAAGLIPVTRLFFFHDPILNPGYNPNSKQGTVTLRGDGDLDIGSARGKRYNNGTILYSVHTGVESCFAVALESLGHADSPYPVRHCRLENMTLVGNNPGFVLEAAGCPQFFISGCKILQENILGGGMKLSAMWFSNMYDTHIINNSGEIAGVGLECSTNNNGGLFALETCLIDGFDTGLLFDSNTFFSDLNITQTAIQSCTIGIKIASLLISMSLRNIHFERCGTELLGEAPVETLNIDGYYSVGRAVTGNKTQPNIRLPGGTRVCRVRGVTTIKNRSSFIEVSGHTTITNSSIHIDGLNYSQAALVNVQRTVNTIEDNGDGFIRIWIPSHQLTTGQDVEIIGADVYNGIHNIVVIDKNNMDVKDVPYTSVYSGGGTLSPRYYAIINTGNISTRVDGFAGATGQINHLIDVHT